MTAPLPPENALLANSSENPSLSFFLERGLEYMRRGCYAEGIAFLAQARAQLTSHQAVLVDITDTLLQKYADYQRMQQMLQEASLSFSEAHVRLQALVTDFVRALESSMKEIEAPDHIHYSPTITKSSHAPTSPPVLSDTQVLSASPVLTEDGTSLPALSVTCFGHFAVKRSGKPVVLCPSRNGQSILRYLIASHGHQATSDILQALLWPEDQPEVAQRKLHIAISVLRRSLNDGISCTPGYILCKNGVYCLNPTATIQTDVEEFLRYYQAGQEKSQERVYFYEKACCLYTGPFLPEDRYADWSFFQREQLSQTYLVMCRTLANHYFMCKRYEDAARWATAVLKEDRCDEIAHRQLIQIYAAQGRRSEALQQYQHCERLLREELGIEPLAETLHILQAVLAGTEVFQNKVET